MMHRPRPALRRPRRRLRCSCSSVPASPDWREWYDVVWLGGTELPGDCAIATWRGLTGRSAHEMSGDGRRESSGAPRVESTPAAGTSSRHAWRVTVVEEHGPVPGLQN